MTAVAVFASLVLVALAIPPLHLAFGRYPELVRRALGIGTVMGLSTIAVAFGGLDWVTWGVIMAGFVVAGAELVALSWLCKRRDAEARRRAAREQVQNAIDQYWKAETD